MGHAMTALFWTSFFFCLYSYFIYPLIMQAVPRRRERTQRVRFNNRRVTLIIAACNEEQRIGEKLENTLALRYPADSREIIVASDQSDDGTDEIVRSYADRGVKLSRSDAGRGKEVAQKAATEMATGSVFVFSDTATMIEPNAIRRLEKYFDDLNVGAVSSEDRFLSPDGRIVGEGLYVRYEMWLRRLESQRAGLVGLSGSFFAARSDVCEDWDTSVPSDFNTALDCVRKGLVAITAPDVHGTYKDIRDPAQEYARKRRTVLRGMTALFKTPQIMNPFHYGMFAFQVISHKLGRWLVPIFLPLLLIASFSKLGDHWFYSLVLALQVAFYILVALGHWSQASRERSVVRVPYYFIQGNLAIARAWIDYVTGRRVTSWIPSKR